VAAAAVAVDLVVRQDGARVAVGALVPRDDEQAVLLPRGDAVTDLTKLWSHENATEGEQSWPSWQRFGVTKENLGIDFTLRRSVMSEVSGSRWRHSDLFLRMSV